MTEFEEKIDKTRAIEGELERTITGLDPVEGARVHIAEPDKRCTPATQTPTTASVAVTTKPGMQLSPAASARHHDAGFARGRGLKPENVTIVNQDGQVLLPPRKARPIAMQPGSAQSHAGSARRQAALRDGAAASIQSMLDQTLGPRHAVARVSTKMNFDANTTETKTYAPTGTVLSAQTKRESYNGTQPRAGCDRRSGNDEQHRHVPRRSSKAATTSTTSPSRRRTTTSPSEHQAHRRARQGAADQRCRRAERRAGRIAARGKTRSSRIRLRPRCASRVRTSSSRPRA